MGTTRYITDWADVPVMIDVAYVANILSMSYEKTRRLVKAGVIPSVRVGDEYRISKSSLMEYLGITERKAV